MGDPSLAVLVGEAAGVVEVAGMAGAGAEGVAVEGTTPVSVEIAQEEVVAVVVGEEGGSPKGTEGIVMPRERGGTIRR